MEQLIILVHVVAALVIIGLIMIQQGKGADMGASFGSGSSQTVFGAAGGGNLLTRMTSVAVTVFFATSLGLAVVAKQKAESIGQVDIEIPLEQSVDALEPVETVEPLLEESIPE